MRTPQGARYSPPWVDVSIIGVAGSSGSGKSTLSNAIVSRLNLPWVAILSMDSFYKPLTAEQSALAFENSYDFDSPEAIDFDKIVEVLTALKAGRRAEIPIYSFSKHQREAETTSIYSPHVLVLEGIFALHDPRVLELLDLKIYCEADADTCLSRRILRDVKERGRDIEGCIKQWFAYVKPNCEKYVEPQRKVADFIVPRGVENQVAMDIMIQHVHNTLESRSQEHCASLKALESGAVNHPLSASVEILAATSQLRGVNTILHDAATQPDDFIFYFNRLAALLIEMALNSRPFVQRTVETPTGNMYAGLEPAGKVCAVLILRGGSAFEPALRRIVPECETGRMLIQSDAKTDEPRLHYCKLPPNMAAASRVLLLDTQIASGGSALMAVQVLLDHGLRQSQITFVSYLAGRVGLHRLSMVFPEITIVVCDTVTDVEGRWVEERYFRC